MPSIAQSVVSCNTFRECQAQPPQAGDGETFAIFDAGRPAGFVRERNGVRFLAKRVDKSRHFHRRIGGFGIGDEALTQAEDLGATFAKFYDNGTGEAWYADLYLFRARGVRIDQGHGPQWILPLRWWTTPDSQPATSPTAPATSQHDEQPTLFDLATIGREVYR